MSEPAPKCRRGERIPTPSSQLLNEARTNLTKTREMAVAMKLARERGELIEKRLVILQASYLLVAMRQKILGISAAYSRKLLNISDSRIMSAQLKKMAYSILEEIKDLPNCVEPGWMGENEDGEKASRSARKK